ncbi:uncharacterized protein LOC134669299 [Cydia fagiglandana]|uniref:uncharacterized protein LOC134669299 n=1 Tax=Cydia fagiglandana TaxID=1458189 RepID=UPI002FEDF3E5
MYYKLKAKSDAMVIELKTCDMINMKWAKDWVEKYSNMTTDTCPVKTGSYRFSGFELPPKNFPLLVLADMNSDYESIFLAYVTKTKEPIIELSVGLSYKSIPKFKRNKSFYEKL